MVNEFQVIDTTIQHWPARGNFAERTDRILICLDVGECPMRQMPRYILQEGEESDRFSAGQLNGKRVKIEVREMSGKGNPTMRGRLVINGSTKV